MYKEEKMGVRAHSMYIIPPAGGEHVLYMERP